MPTNLGTLNLEDSNKLESIAFRMHLKPKELARLIIKKFLMEAYEEKTVEQYLEIRRHGSVREKVPVQSFIDYYHKVWLPKECPGKVVKNKGDAKS